MLSIEADLVLEADAAEDQVAADDPRRKRAADLAAMTYIPSLGLVDEIVTWHESALERLKYVLQLVPQLVDDLTMPAHDGLALFTRQVLPRTVDREPLII